VDTGTTVPTAMFTGRMEHASSISRMCECSAA
jgi:hypothetical protein